MDGRRTPLGTDASAPPIRFRSVAALFRALDQCRAQEEDFAVAEGVDVRAFAAIDRARERRSTHERLHYRPGSQTLYISLPMRAHERAHTGLFLVLVDKLRRMGVSLDEYALDGATTFTAVSGGGSGGSDGSDSEGTGEGDQTFVPLVRDDTLDAWPTLVVEIGVTQPRAELRRKMAWWLAASDHQVQIVVLIKVVRSARALLLETYALPQQPQRPGATATRSTTSSLVPQRRQSITVAPRPGTAPADHLYDVVGAPLVLEFLRLFLRPADPARGERDVEISAAELAWLAKYCFRLRLR